MRGITPVERDILQNGLHACRGGEHPPSGDYNGEISAAFDLLVKQGRIVKQTCPHDPRYHHPATTATGKEALKLDAIVNGTVFTNEAGWS